jgi:hypothetical protein
MVGRQLVRLPFEAVQHLAHVGDLLLGDRQPLEHGKLRA